MGTGLSGTDDGNRNESAIPLRVTSLKDEERYLEEHPCDCFGSWSLGDIEVIREDATERHFRRHAQCTSCGNRKAFEFIGAADVFAESDESEVEARKQHYAFAHSVLHENFFGSPREMLGLLTSPAGQRRLRAVWDDIGSNVTDRRTADAEELCVSSRTLGGRAGCLVSFPKPITSPEAYFVAMLPATQADPVPRYFVLEHTSLAADGSKNDPQDTTPRAVLCEWLAGRKRRNHSVVIVSPTVESFCQGVEAQLKEEGQRRQLGARAIATPTWDLPADEDPGSAMFSGGAYRLQFCVFAFHLLPRGAESISCEDLDAASNKVLELWNEAGDICERKQQPRSSAVPSVRSVSVAGQPHVLVEMPEPVSPPEPVFALLPASAGQPVLLLELSNHRTRASLFTCISQQEQHGIVRGVKSPDLHAFIEAAEAYLERRLTADSPPELLKHLVLYAEISDVSRR